MRIYFVNGVCSASISSSFQGDPLCVLQEGEPAGVLRRDFCPRSKTGRTRKPKQGRSCYQTTQPRERCSKTHPKQFQFCVYDMTFHSGKFKRSLLRHVFLPLLCVAQVAENCVFSVGQGSGAGAAGSLLTLSDGNSTSNPPRC